MFDLKNKTVLITGASSGIGKEIARKFAAAGASLVLVARSETSLAHLAGELTKRFGVRTTVIAADLSLPDCATTVFGETERHSISVDVLVNNAGFGTYGAFETLPPETEQNEIAVNVSALVGLTHAFVPGMIKRGGGAVLNIASTSSFQPAPFMAVYAATKAFVLSFSEALWAEFRDRGVHVVALCPGPVDTGFVNRIGNASITQTSVFSSMIRPEQVADEALKALKGKAPTRIIGFKNSLMAFSVRLAPRSVVALSGANMLRPRSAKTAKTGSVPYR